MLDAGHEQHRLGQLEARRGAALHLVVELDQGQRGEVHRVEHVARERQHRRMRRHLVGIGLLEGGEFKATHRLHRHQVRPGALPAARQGGAVEVEHQPVRRGIFHDVQVVADHRLPVAAEEVDLHPGHAHRLEPRERADAAGVGQHAVARGLRRVVPAAGRVVPEQDGHVLAARVSDQLVHPVFADLRVPQGVDQGIAPAHARGEVDVALLHGEGGGAVAEQRPAPRRLARLRRRDRRDRGRVGQVGTEGGLGDGLQAADRDDAPRRAPWQREARIGGAAGQHLARIGHADRVLAGHVGDLAQAAAGMAAAERALAEQDPVRRMAEQGRIHPAGCERRRRADADVLQVILLVRGIGPAEAGLGRRHRLQPGARGGGEAERGGVLAQLADRRVALRESVAERDAVVGDLEFDLQALAVGAAPGEHAAVGVVVVDAPLAGQQFVAIVHWRDRRHREQAQALGEIGIIADQAQSRAQQHLAACAQHAVVRAAGRVHTHLRAQRGVRAEHFADHALGGQRRQRAQQQGAGRSDHRRRPAPAAQNCGFFSHTGLARQ